MRSLISYISFLAVFLSLYGSLNYFLYRKLKKAFSIKLFYRSLLIIIFMCLMAMPFISRAFETNEYYFSARVFAYLAYFWMSAVFLFFSCHLVLDLFSGIIRLISIISNPDLLKFQPNRKKSFILIALLIIVILAYGTYEADNIKIKTISLETSDLPLKTKSVKIVQVSDTHFSIINGIGLAKRIVNIIESLDPHVIVLTGDFIDRNTQDKEKITTLFRNLNPRYGKFAVTGNHEFYGGLEKSIEFIEEAGFKMLRNESVVLDMGINLAGVDDSTAKRFGLTPSLSEEKVLKMISNKGYTILLKHRPEIKEESKGLFNLQLSGHTHNGQIFPFKLVTSAFFHYNQGLFRVGEGAHLYVSKGTGTWGPPIRFLSPPEVTLIELNNLR